MLMHGSFVERFAAANVPTRRFALCVQGPRQLGANIATAEALTKACFPVASQAETP